MQSPTQLYQAPCPPPLAMRWSEPCGGYGSLWWSRRFLRSMCSALMATCIMLYISPTLGAVVLGVVPVLVCTAAAYGAFVRRLSKRVMDALAKATESAEESLGNIRTVRAFSKELSEIEKYQRSVHDAFKLGTTVRMSNCRSPSRTIRYAALYVLLRTRTDEA